MRSPQHFVDFDHPDNHPLIAAPGGGAPQPNSKLKARRLTSHLSSHIVPVLTPALIFGCAVVNTRQEAKEALDTILANPGEGVLWPHCRLQVRGPGGAGKTSTIDAMSGKAFVKE